VHVLCSDLNEDGYFRKCVNCPSQITLQERLEFHFDMQMIDTITFYQWESTDRGNIMSITKSADEFVSDFIYLLKKLITHDFIAKQQAGYKKNLTENFEYGDVIVNLDFGENFSFDFQSSSQGMYFNNKQATIHLCIIHYKNEAGEIAVKFFVG